MVTLRVPFFFYQTLREVLQKCFREAEASGFKSIALPPAGTGQLGYPVGDVATIILEEVAAYSSNQQYPSLKNVYIVVHHKDSEKAQVRARSLH